MQPAATTFAPESAAASNVSMESFLAESMNPQVLTTITAGSSSLTFQPAASSRAASSSESTSLRAQPKVISDAVRRDDMVDTTV